MRGIFRQGSTGLLSERRTITDIQGRDGCPAPEIFQRADKTGADMAGRMCYSVLENAGK